MMKITIAPKRKNNNTVDTGLFKVVTLFGSLEKDLTLYKKWKGRRSAVHVENLHKDMQKLRSLSIYENCGLHQK